MIQYSLMIQRLILLYQYHNNAKKSIIKYEKIDEHYCNKYRVDDLVF